MTPTKVCRYCHVVVMVVGAGFLAIGLFVVPVLPYFQLDVVLSPTELRNQQVHDATLGMLKAASGNQWLVWIAAGGLLVVTGVIGFFASQRLDSDQSTGESTSQVPKSRTAQCCSDS
jgi:hypothetical protein